MKRKNKKFPFVNLRQIKAFQDLLPAQLDILNSATITNLYKPRQIIFYQGNLAHGLYCIGSGKVKVYKEDSEGHQQIVRLLGPGEMMGYRCMILEEPYTTTAETIEESAISFIDKNTFLQILKDYPKVATHLMKTVIHDLLNAEKQMLHLAHKNIRERFAELLLMLKSKYGRQTNAGVHLKILLSREEMGEMIGATSESVIRLISEMKQENLIQVKGRQIVLLNLPQLIQIANLAESSF